MVELIPEPGNPADSAAVALDIEGERIGYLRHGMAVQFQPEIVAANHLGFRVLAQAKVFESSYDAGILPIKKNGKSDRAGLESGDFVSRELNLRGTWPENLASWLILPEAVRGPDFFEPTWHTPDRQDDFQEQLSDILLGRQTFVTECELLLGTTEDGLGVDVYIDDVHLGTLRPHSVHQNELLIRTVRSGRRSGIAVLKQWPDNVALRVFIPDLEFLSKKEGFVWADEAQARREAAYRDLDERLARAKAIECFQGRLIHEWSEPIDKLYRAGKYHEALELLVPLISVDFEYEALVGRTPGFYFTERAAIICRKLADYATEVELLERYVEEYGKVALELGDGDEFVDDEDLVELHAENGVPSKIKKRLDRARVLREKAKAARH